MIEESPVVLVVAEYHLRDEAQADLSMLQRYIIDRRLEFYDGALIETDAWNQAEIREWATPALSGVPGLIRRSLAGLVGGPRATRRERVLALDPEPEGLARGDLQRIATSMKPDSTLVVAAVQTAHVGSFLACFPNARRKNHAVIPVESVGVFPSLSAALDQLVSDV